MKCKFRTQCAFLFLSPSNCCRLADITEGSCHGPPNSLQFFPPKPPGFWANIVVACHVTGLWKKNVFVQNDLVLYWAHDNWLGPTSSKKTWLSLCPFSSLYVSLSVSLSLSLLSLLSLPISLSLSPFSSLSPSLSLTPGRSSHRQRGALRSVRTTYLADSSPIAMVTSWPTRDTLEAGTQSVVGSKPPSLFTVCVRTALTWGSFNTHWKRIALHIHIFIYKHDTTQPIITQHDSIDHVTHTMYTV